MDSEILEQTIDEYLDIYNNKDESFKKFNVNLPEHIRNKFFDFSSDIKQAKLETGILASVAIKEYHKYLEELYKVHDRTNEKNFDKVQTAFVLSNNTVNYLDSIVEITGLSDRTTAFRNAIEFLFNNNKKSIEQIDSNAD